MLEPILGRYFSLWNRSSVKSPAIDVKQISEQMHDCKGARTYFIVYVVCTVVHTAYSKYGLRVPNTASHGKQRNSTPEGHHTGEGRSS